MIVVTQREAGRQQAQVRQRHLAPERPQPGVEVGDRWLVSRSAILRMNHFAGTRRILCVPSSLVRAPTTWSYDGSSRSIRTSSGIRSFG